MNGLLVRSACAAGIAVALLAAMGCTRIDYTARFIGYDTLEDGSRIALLKRSGGEGQPPQIVRAITDIADLMPGEMVEVQVQGKTWEDPQWKPEDAVMGRAHGTPEGAD